MRFSFGEIISLLRLLLEHIRQKKKKRKKTGQKFLVEETEPGLNINSLQVSLEHFSSKPWLCYNSTWWICINEFASNLIRRAIQLPATPLLRTSTLRKIPGDEESLYAKLGDCYANDHHMCFFSLFVCFCLYSWDSLLIGHSEFRRIKTAVSP